MKLINHSLLAVSFKGAGFTPKGLRHRRIAESEVPAEKFLQAVLEEFSCGNRKGGAPPSSMSKVRVSGGRSGNGKRGKRPGGGGAGTTRVQAPELR